MTQNRYFRLAVPLSIAGLLLMVGALAAGSARAAPHSNSRLLPAPTMMPTATPPPSISNPNPGVTKPVNGSPPPSGSHPNPGAPPPIPVTGAGGTAPHLPVTGGAAGGTSDPALPLGLLALATIMLATRLRRIGRT